MSERSGGKGEDHPELGPLPGGHHGLSRRQIAESQRERLLAAVVPIVAERGYRAATITEIVKVASISTRDFYLHFESVEQCFLAAFDAVYDHFKRLVADAVVAEDEWAFKVIAALRAALNYFASEPDFARLCLVEPLTSTPTIAVRFREAVLEGVPALAAGRADHGNGDSLPESTEDSLLGGLVSLASRSLLTDGAGSLPALLPDLVEFVLAPYLGPERAAELAAAAVEERPDSSD